MNSIQARTQLDRWHDLAPADRREARLRVQLIRAETPAGEAAEALARTYLDGPDGQWATALGSEVFLALYAVGKPATALAARVADRLAAKDAAQSWASARLAARDGRRDDALRLARAAIAEGSRTEVIEAARAITSVATSPGQDRAPIDSSASAMDAAVAREPRVSDLRVMSGILRHLQERYVDEAACYRAALDIQPSHAIARNNLAWVLGEDQSKHADGLAIIDALIRDEGPDAERLGTRGVILMRLGRLPDAIHDLEESIKLRPASLTSYYLALAFHKAGRSTDSALALASALKGGLSPSEIDSPQRAEYEALLASSRAGR